MKIRLIVRHTVKPQNPIRKIVKTVKYHANADGTVTTSSTKKVVNLGSNSTDNKSISKNYVMQDV